MLELERTGAVAVLSIDRPDRRNAMDDRLIGRMMEMLRELNSDPGVRAIVLNGAAPGFCAGSDLKFIGRLPLDATRRFEADTGIVARSLGLADKPVVAAVEGFAIGGGFILAVSCDLVVTSAVARWHLPEVPIGWLTPWGLQALIARVGPVRAKALCFGIAPFDGVEARRLRIADHVVPAGEVLAEALRRAQALAQLPTQAAIAGKQFFAPAIMAYAEVRDSLANRLFAENCRHPTAMATLTRYGLAGDAPTE